MDAATQEYFDAVMARLLEGEPEPGDGVWLAELIRRDAAAARQVTGLLEIDALLRQEMEPDAEAFPESVRIRLENEVEGEVFGRRVARMVSGSRDPLGVLWRNLHWAVAAVAVVLVACFLFSHLHSDVAPAPASHIAFLRRSASATWAADAVPPVTDGPLGAGRIRLESGLAEIEFVSGARMIVEGPASLVIHSTTEMTCQEGRLRVFVPPQAHGFRVHVAGLSIVDLGTSFGVVAQRDQAPLLKVFQGEVEVATARQQQRVGSGEALTADAAGVLATVVIGDDQFPTEAELRAGRGAEERQRLHGWRATMRRLAADPATVLCYTFEADDLPNRLVRNRATGAPERSHGLLVGAGWTDGRWPGKHAVDFRGASDRLRFAVPGEMPALTMLAWVRVDSLPNEYSGLLLPTREATGVIHWMLERNGDLRLSLLNDARLLHRGGGWDGPVKAPAIAEQDFGRWVQLATTYDAATGLVVHYRDGRCIGEGRFPRRRPALFESVEFGNLAPDVVRPGPDQPPHPASFVTRNFVGRLDELVILARVMPADELARLYQAGRP